MSSMSRRVVGNSATIKSWHPCQDLVVGRGSEGGLLGRRALRAASPSIALSRPSADGSTPSSDRASNGV